MRPQHLWDHSSETFITDGYQAFTGIVEIKTSGRRTEKHKPAISTVYVSSFLIFGYAAGKFGVAEVNNEPQKHIVPWAGIFSISDTGVSSQTSQLFNSEEKLQWIPDAIHKVREIVLARVDNGWKLPTVCKLGAFWIDNNDTHGSLHFERAIRLVLLTEMEESSEGSIYKIALNFEKL
jgi:hypothetical protein